MEVWTSIDQGQYNCFSNNSNSQDGQFTAKVNELFQTRARFSEIYPIITSFKAKTSIYQTILDEFSQKIRLVYSESSPFNKYIEYVTKAHLQLKDAYEKCSNDILQLTIETDAQNKRFMSLDDDIAKREELKKNYEIQDNEMAKIVKELNEKLANNKDNKKELEKFNKIKENFQNAVNIYVDHSNKTYGQMNDVIETNFYLFTETLNKFVYYERKLYAEAAKIFETYNLFYNSIVEFKNTNKKKPQTYDAIIYIRGKDLINRTQSIKKYNITEIQGVIGGNNDMNNGIINKRIDKPGNNIRSQVNQPPTNQEKYSYNNNNAQYNADTSLYPSFNNSPIQMQNMNELSQFNNNNQYQHSNIRKCNTDQRISHNHFNNNFPNNNRGNINYSPQNSLNQIVSPSNFSDSQEMVNAYNSRQGVIPVNDSQQSLQSQQQNNIAPYTHPRNSHNSSNPNNQSHSSYSPIPSNNISNSYHTQSSAPSTLTHNSKR